MPIKLEGIKTGTSFQAQGMNGANPIKGLGTATGAIIRKGLSPYLDPDTGTWWEYDDDLKDYKDTGLNAGIESLEQVVISTESGGLNVVRATFSDGTIHDFKIHNGARGADGYTPVKGKDYFDGKDGYTPVKGKDYFDGKDGYSPRKNVDYFDGKDGVGVKSVTQTTTSTQDGGTNLWTMELTNGKLSRFQVRNGKRGSDGKDYQITARDYDAIAQKTLVFISPGDIGAIDEDNAVSLKEIASWFAED